MVTAVKFPEGTEVMSCSICCYLYIQISEGRPVLMNSQYSQKHKTSTVKVSSDSGSANTTCQTVIQREDRTNIKQAQCERYGSTKAMYGATTVVMYKP